MQDKKTPSPTQPSVGQLAIFLLATVILAIVGGYSYAWRWEDAYWYKTIAEGEMAHCIAPFSHRPLSPLIVRGLAGISGLTVEQCFFCFGVFSIAFFAGLAGWILVRERASRSMLALVALISFWPLSFENYVLPDLFNAALLCAFIAMIARKRYLWASLMLVPLGVSRESVLVVLACFLFAAWRELRWLEILTAVGGTCAGLSIVKYLSRTAAPNRHHLSPLVYIAGKIPWNFAANVLGLAPWSNDLHTFCATPRWSANLPFHLGGITTFGYCGYTPLLQLRSACSVLCLFGILPLLFTLLVTRGLVSLWPKEVFMRFCLLYGGLSLCLAPFLGSAVDRLISYSWPLFVIAVPIEASTIWGMTGSAARALLAINCLISWTGFYLLQFSRPEVLLIFLAIVVAPAYCYTWRTISKLLSAPSRETRPLRA